MTPSPEQWQAIARAGVMAPSADNCHVFVIEFAQGTLKLWPTPAFAGCRERHRKILGWISLGAVVENMRLQAAAMAWRTNCRWGDGEREPLAELTLRPSMSALDVALAPAMAKRRTNRKMYRGPELSATERAALDAAAAIVPGVRLHWLQGADRRKVLGLIWRAESERFLRQRLHQELFSSIRFDLDWRRSCEQALAPGSLEVEAPMRPFFKVLRHWPLMRVMNGFGAHRMLGLRAGWLPCWQAPALGFLTTQGEAEEGAVGVGTAFQRLWLQATQSGLALQPMAAAAVLPLQSDMDQGASAALRARLTDTWAEIAPAQTPLMVFRLGRASLATAVSGRRPLADHLRQPGLDRP